MRVVFPFHSLDGYARVLRTVYCKGGTFSFLQLRRFALPCSSLSDSDLSSSDGAGNDSPSPNPSAEMAEVCNPVVGSMRDGRKIGVSARRKYSFTRRWYSREEMMKRVAFVLQSRSWDFGFPNEPKIELDESKVSLILNELFDGSSDAALVYFFFRWSQRHNGYKHGVYPVCLMIHLSVLGNMNHIAVKLIRDIIQSIRGWRSHQPFFGVLKETSKDGKALETAYSMLVGCYIDEGMIDVALQLINFIKVQGMYPAGGVLVTLVKRLLESQELELALSIFVEALQCGRDLSKQILSLFIHHLCVQNNLADAYKLFCKMHVYGCKPDVISYTIIIDALCKRGLLEEGMLLFYQLVGDEIYPDVVLISSVVDGYCKAGRFLEAVQIMKDFNCAPDEFIYNSFICELCGKGNMIDASKLLIEMSECGVFPDCNNWTTVISGYCKANQIGQALKLFGGMLKRGLHPTITTYTVLIESYCKFGDMKEAENVLYKMRKHGLIPDLIAFNVLIHGHSKQGRVQKALELLDMMKADGTFPDVVTYNILIHVLIKEGFFMEAREILSELASRGYSPDKFTYTSMIDGLLKKGNFQEAFRTWCLMNKSGSKPDVVCCSALIDGFCKARRMLQAHAVFHKMLESGITPDLKMYSTLISGFCREGDVQEACRLLNMMAETNIIPNGTTYWALVRGLERNSVQNSMQVAAIKIEQILVKNNIFVDEHTYVVSCACED